MKTLHYLSIILLITSSNLLTAQECRNDYEQPQWAYQTLQGRYFFIPEINTYYDTQTAMYIFTDNNRWVHHYRLPRHLRNFHINRNNVVIIENYYGPNPYAYCPPPPVCHQRPAPVVVYNNYSPRYRRGHHVYNEHSRHHR